MKLLLGSKKSKLSLLIIIAMIFITGCSFKDLFVKENQNKEYLKGKVNVQMIVKDYGTIELELDADVAPITVTNFVNLVNDKFYDGLTFHRVVSGFMIQGGDPNHDGSGGLEETIKGEFTNNGVENTISHVRGVISMARRGGYPDTSETMNSASSQFFIVHKDSTFLDGNYAAFGHVTKGMDVVDKIVATINPTENDIEIAYEKQPVITSIRVIE